MGGNEREDLAEEAEPAQGLEGCLWSVKVEGRGREGRSQQEAAT